MLRDMDTPPLVVIGTPASLFKTRRAVRAVVHDDAGKIALFHVANRGYHKLPGGGVEESEDDESALKRECREELGCIIEIEQPIGLIREYQESGELEQDSYCFVARAKEDSGQTSLTKEEASDGFTPLWVFLGDAMRLLQNDSPADSDSQSIVRRDIVFLEEYKKMTNA